MTGEKQERRDNQVIVVFGRKRRGKTTYLKQAAAAEWKAGHEFFFFDPQRQADDLFGVHVYDTFDLFSYLSTYGDHVTVIAHTPSAAAFSDIVKILPDLSDCTVFLDEIGLYTDAHSDELDEFLRVAGQRGISIYLSTHRPSDVPRLATHCLDRLVCFQTHEPSDIVWLSKHFTPDEIEKIKSLPVGQYVEKSY